MTPSPMIDPRPRPTHPAPLVGWVQFAPGRPRWPVHLQDAKLHYYSPFLGLLLPISPRHLAKVQPAL